MSIKVGDKVKQKRSGYVGHTTWVSRDGLNATVDFDVTFQKGLSVVNVRTGGLISL